MIAYERATEKTLVKEYENEVRCLKLLTDARCMRYLFHGSIVIWALILPN